jgi:hypothetical protein
MGSIQAMRSEALAMRAKEDTALQVSMHLGSVNKSLGGQITSMIDQLQGVINERTKAYNGLVTKLNKAIQGKGGLGDQAIKSTFGVVTTLMAIVAFIKDQSASNIVTAICNVVTLILGFLGAQESVAASILDYKKMISQIGYSDADFNETDGFTQSGASGMARIRDSLMPRYKSEDLSTFGNRGYVGTLRRI